MLFNLIIISSSCHKWNVPTRAPPSSIVLLNLSVLHFVLWQEHPLRPKSKTTQKIETCVLPGLSCCSPTFLCSLGYFLAGTACMSANFILCHVPNYSTSTSEKRKKCWRICRQWAVIQPHCTIAKLTSSFNLFYFSCALQIATLAS